MYVISMHNMDYRGCQPTGMLTPLYPRVSVLCVCVRFWSPQMPDPYEQFTGGLQEPF